MKKVILLTLAGAISFGSFAQKKDGGVRLETKSSAVKPSSFATSTNPLAKTTGVTDTFLYMGQSELKQIFDTSSFSRVDVVAPADSGFYFGTNPLNTTAYAEQFYAAGYGGDTTLTVLGFYALFTGHVSPTSSKTISVNVWQKGPQTAISTKYYNSGLPGTSMKAMTLPITHLGIGTNGADSVKATYFATPLTGVNYDFFLGYEMNYTWSSLNGDTLGLRSSRAGYGVGVGGYINNSGDTILYDQNTFKFNGNWYDVWDNFGFNRNLSIVPIVQFNASTIPTSVQGITKNNLTFFGNYPNPAVNSTNVKFALKNSADVTVSIYDMNGRVINTISQSKLGAGEHTIAVETASLAAGTYVYMVRTSNGDAMASQMSVVK